MRIHLCGVRGSTPAPGAAFAVVGGHTSCIAVAHDDEEVPRLLLDAGTGLRAVPALLGGEAFHGTILLGHLHWDHMMGLPFFKSADNHDAVTRVIVPEQGATALELLSETMRAPAFPIGPTDLRGTWSFDTIDEGECVIEGFTVLAREIPHPGGRAMGYRISDAHSSIVYMSDHGPAGEMGPGPDGFGPYHEAAMTLCAGVDLLIHDSQYTASELPGRLHFGHSAVDYPIELAKRAGARGVLLFHHDPDRTDVQVDAIEQSFQGIDGLRVHAAREGDTICIGTPIA